MTRPTSDQIAEAVGWVLIWTAASVVIGWWVVLLAIGIGIVRAVQ